MADKHNHLLELVMFDIAYVISNCDYEYSSDEKKYLNVILDRYSDDDKELLKLRTQFLDSILEKGIEEVKSFVVNLSKSLKSKIDNDMKEAYLELFKEVIMLVAIDRISYFINLALFHFNSICHYSNKVLV